MAPQTPVNSTGRHDAPSSSIASFERMQSSAARDFWKHSQLSAVTAKDPGEGVDRTRESSSNALLLADEFARVPQHLQISCEPMHWTENQTALNSDDVKSLFNINPSQIAPVSGVPINGDFPSLRSSSNGFVPHTPSRGSRSGLHHHRSDLSAVDSPGTTGGVALDVGDTAFLPRAQLSAFELPGLGADQANSNVFGTHPASSFRGPPHGSTKIAFQGNGVPGFLDQLQHHAPQAFNAAFAGSFEQLPSERQSTLTSTRDLSAGAISLGTPQTKKNGSSGSSEKASASGVSESTNSVGVAPVWEQKQHNNAFKMQNVVRNNLSQAFKGAFNILGTLNPDHFQMPWGSRVVCIKATCVDHIYASLQTGLWSTNPNVMARIVALWENRPNKSEKILLLWSIPGSKNFCGLAEMEDYRPDAKFFDVQKGAMVVRWLYCKMVSYDEIRKIDCNEGPESVTQMWNGMHYAEDIGRKVIKTYVESPHFSNLLAKPAGGHFQRRNNPAVAPRKNTVTASRNITGGAVPNDRAQNGEVRAEEHPRVAGTGAHKSARVDDKKSDAAHESVHLSPKDAETQKVAEPQMTAETQKAVEAQMVAETHKAVEAQKVAGTVSSIQAGSAMIESKKGAAEPRVQMMPVYVHADGTITPAVSLQSSLSTLEEHTGQSMHSSNMAPPVSTPLSQISFPEAPSGKFPSSDKMNYGHLGAHNIFPPKQPFAYQNMGGYSSTPAVNRYAQNGYSTPGGGYQNGRSQPQTPVGRAYYSHQNMSGKTGSPMDRSQTTPTPRAPMAPFMGDFGFANGHTVSSYEQTFPQFYTPIRTPTAKRVQTPVQRGEASTPRASAGKSSGHRARGSHGFSSLESRTNRWIDDLVESPGRKE